MVSGIPHEHLRRRVREHQTPILKVKAYTDNFKWKGPQMPRRIRPVVFQVLSAFKKS